jgi:ABC-type transport system involved in multi-copper enzyme maturation permease subunit
MNINSVLYKELKVRMRSWKIVWLIMIYLAILAMSAVLVLMTTTQRYSPYGVDASMAIGAYTTLAIMQFLLIVFIAPSLTSGSISGERERQTLDLLLCTKMSPHSIVIGKLFSSISQIILLIVASLPIFSIVLLFGGISMGEVLKLFLFYIVVAITMGSIGIFFSTFFKRTTASNVITYGFILFLLFGTLFINVFYTQLILRGKAYEGVFPLSYINPLTAFVSLLYEQFGGNGSGLGILGIFMSLPRTSVQKKTPLNSIPLWQVNIIISMVLSAVMLFLSSVKVNPIKKKLFTRNKK